MKKPSLIISCIVISCFIVVCIIVTVSHHNNNSNNINNDSRSTISSLRTIGISSSSSETSKISTTTTIDETNTSSIKATTEAKSSSIHANDIPLITFDDVNNLPIWIVMNDPVMGGKSTSNFTINKDEGYGIFNGEVVNVPFLHAPGFIQAYSLANYPNIQNCNALTITCKPLTNYTGYKISFSYSRGKRGSGCGFFSLGYKTSLDIRYVNVQQRITIPFTKFSNCNDDKTGLPVHTCDEDTIFCPDSDTLKNINVLTIWGEGVAGDVMLEIYRIDATECSTKQLETKYSHIPIKK